MHNTYHEVFHLARNGKECHKDELVNRRYHEMEETMAEVSASAMTKNVGIDGKSLAYSDEIVRILPRLKKSEEYKDCKTMSDFGKIFIAKRRSNNVSIKSEVEAVSGQRFREGPYLAQYRSKSERHLDLVMDAIVKPKDRDEYVKGMIKNEFNDAFDLLESGKPMSALSFNQRLVATCCIRREMELGGIL